jgi:hypothetical protein
MIRPSLIPLFSAIHPAQLSLPGKIPLHREPHIAVLRKKILSALNHHKPYSGYLALLSLFHHQEEMNRQ